MKKALASEEAEAVFGEVPKIRNKDLLFFDVGCCCDFVRVGLA